ncbi:MAG: pyridoxamine 5'-phosphate oxidase family protein, partial [Candidatus Methylomirabilia bacterium]
MGGLVACPPASPTATLLTRGSQADAIGRPVLGLRAHSCERLQDLLSGVDHRQPYTNMAKTRQHSYTTTEHDLNPAPETTYAERSRTLLHRGKVGVLSTHSQKQKGFPFGSVMPYALDAAGSPLFLISGMAMHTQNLVGDPRASLFVTAPEAKADPLGAARLTVIGKASKVLAAELKGVREVYLRRHENARYWVDF